MSKAPIMHAQLGACPESVVAPGSGSWAGVGERFGSVNWKRDSRCARGPTHCKRRHEWGTRLRLVCDLHRPHLRSSYWAVDDRRGASSRAEAADEEFK